MADEKVEEKKEEVATPAPASTAQDDEIKAKEEQRTNLEKAIAEGNAELRAIREAKKKEKSAVTEEEIPQIDDNDPSAKAWTKRISESTAPISSQLDKQKEEVRTFALRRFLADKPALAKSPEKLKELMSNYERIKVATEQTQEGVLLDLDKAYGATFYEDLVSAARNARADAAREDMIASDIAISKGSTSEAAPVTQKRKLSAEEQKIVDQWELYGAPKVD